MATFHPLSAAAERNSPPYFQQLVPSKIRLGTKAGHQEGVSLTLTPLEFSYITHTLVLVAWIYLHFLQLKHSSGLEDSRGTLWGSGCLWHSSPEIRTWILVRMLRLLPDKSAQSSCASWGFCLQHFTDRNKCTSLRNDPWDNRNLSESPNTAASDVDITFCLRKWSSLSVLRQPTRALWTYRKNHKVLQRHEQYWYCTQGNNWALYQLCLLYCVGTVKHPIC